MTPLPAIRLAMLGGVAGLLLAYWAQSALWSFRPPFLQPDSIDINPDIRVLLTTGYFRTPGSDLARHRVLRKPYDETALLAALEGTLNSRGAEPMVVR